MCPILEWVNTDCPLRFRLLSGNIWCQQYLHLPFTIRHPFVLPAIAYNSRERRHRSLDINCSRNITGWDEHCSYAPLGNNSTMSSMARWVHDGSVFLPKILLPSQKSRKVSFYTCELLKSTNTRTCHAPGLHKQFPLSVINLLNGTAGDGVPVSARERPRGSRGLMLATRWYKQ